MMSHSNHVSIGDHDMFSRRGRQGACPDGTRLSCCTRGILAELVETGMQPRAQMVS